MSDVQVAQTVVNCLGYLVPEKSLWKSGSQLSKYFKAVPPLLRMLVEYMVKSHRQLSFAYLTNWTDLTKSNL